MAVGKIKVLGRPYSVDLVDDLGDSYGECDYESATIEIVDGLEPLLHKEILLHETMHAVLRQQGRYYCKAEETYVSALAVGLLAVLRDNPKLAKELLC